MHRLECISTWQIYTTKLWKINDHFILLWFSKNDSTVLFLNTLINRSLLHSAHSSVWPVELKTWIKGNHCKCLVEHIENNNYRYIEGYRYQRINRRYGLLVWFLTDLNIFIPDCCEKGHRTAFWGPLQEEQQWFSAGQPCWGTLSQHLLQVSFKDLRLIHTRVFCCMIYVTWKAQLNWKPQREINVNPCSGTAPSH